MKAPDDVPRFRDYLAMLVRAWPMLLVATLLSAGVAVGAMELRKPNYAASVMLFATVAGDPSTFASYYGSMGAMARMPTYTQLAKSTLIAQRTVDELKLPVTAENLAGRVSAEWVPGGVDVRGRAASVVLRVSVTDHDPDAAVKEANAVAGNLMAVSRELEWHEAKPADAIQYNGAVAELMPVGRAQTAQLVPVPVLTLLAIGAGVGLAISVAIMLAVEISRDTVDSCEQLNHIVKVATQGKT